MSYKNYDFRDKLKESQIGVEFVKRMLLLQPIHINLIDAQDDKRYQDAGIDLLWVVNAQGIERTVGVEVKTDTYFETGNLFLEIISNMTKQTPGCFISSRADVYAYFFTGVDVLYWIPLKKAQAWLKINYQRFPERVTSTGNGTNHFYKTKGILVPRDVLLREVWGTKEIKLGE